MTTIALILLAGAVGVLAYYVVDHHYQLRTLHNYAREWGTPLGKRGACRKGRVGPGLKVVK